GGLGQDLGQPLDGAPADAQPIGIKGGARGGHAGIAAVLTALMLSDVGILPEDLLPAQRQAVTFTGGSLVVLGAAGTGKTRVVAERFRWLVDQGYRPERIALMAPSQGRADALREWLERGLSEGYDELAVGTPAEPAT